MTIILIQKSLTLNIHTKMKGQSHSIRIFLYFLLAILVIIPYLGLFGAILWYNHKAEKIANAKFIIVNKETMSLGLYDYKGVKIKEYGISCGKNMGNKKRIGDNKTPEGIFHISEIEESSSWAHDFNDGKGKIVGAYGPWFIRLEVPDHKGIGIHGTHKPTSIGTRDTEGCIRLTNDDISDLRTRVSVGMVVVILPSYRDLSTILNDSLIDNNMYKLTIKNV